RDRVAQYWQRLVELDGEELQADAEVPPAIQGIESTQDARGPRRPFVGDLVARRLTPPSLDLRPPGDQDDRVPPDKGFLFVALAGDEVRLARRQAAWDRIRTCSNPMPQVGMIIEGQPVPERRGGP